MPKIGAMELIIILVIVLIVFGVGRLGQIGGALGKGIREVRKGQAGELDNEVTEAKPSTSTSKRKSKGKV